MIKTFGDLANWCAGVAETFGSPTASTGLAFFEYRRHRVGTESELLCCTFDDEESSALLLQMVPYAREVDDELLRLPVKMGDCEIAPEGVESFGLHLIAPGLWALQPSLNVPDLLHVFVTIYGVPDPAPWERRIVIAR